jgi:8-amino-7-oxononanoate synthase
MGPLQTLLQDLRRDLRSLEAKALRRKLLTVEKSRGPIVRVNGQDRVNWCSNDYLGLALHPRLAAAASKAARQHGMGARASRLLCGTSYWHTQLEQALASWFKAEAALVFSSGYLANLGVLGSLLGPGDWVLVDRLSHASLIDAARATRATLRVFAHNDAGHAKRLLARCPSSGRRMIVTEGVFSMDGDRSPVADLLLVAEEAEALLYLDDAHGAFVLGESGRGSPQLAGVASDRLIYMATLGKAAGCQGGFVAGAQTLIDWLISRSRTFIYSTALATPIAAAACEALGLMRQQPGRRRLLARLAQRLHTGLRRQRLTPLPQPSHILPVWLCDTQKAAELASRLSKRGMWCPAIRPPTVPANTARLRISVTAAHTMAHVDALLAALEEEMS